VSMRRRDGGLLPERQEISPGLKLGIRAIADCTCSSIWSATQGLVLSLAPGNWTHSTFRPTSKSCILDLGSLCKASKAPVSTR